MMLHKTSEFFFTNFAYRNDTAKAQREMWQGSCCHFIGKSIGEKRWKWITIFNSYATNQNSMFVLPHCVYVATAE